MMPGSTGPNLGLDWGYDPHDSGWGNGYNNNALILDTLVNGTVISVTNTPPVSPSDGDRYVVSTAPTGTWSGHANAIAVYLSIGGAAWHYLTPKNGWQVFNLATGRYFRFNGSNWILDVAAQVPASATISKTADYTVLVTDNWNRFNNIGAGSDIVLTLPAAADGLIIGFAVRVAHYIKVMAAGAETISLAATTSAGGGYVRSNIVNSYLQLESHELGKWFASTIIPTWTVDS